MRVMARINSRDEICAGDVYAQSELVSEYGSFVRSEFALQIANWKLRRCARGSFHHVPVIIDDFTDLNRSKIIQSLEKCSHKVLLLRI